MLTSAPSAAPYGLSQLWQLLSGTCSQDTGVQVEEENKHYQQE